VARREGPPRQVPPQPVQIPGGQQPGQVELAHQRRQDVVLHQVVRVVRPVQVGGHERVEVAAVLGAVVGAELERGDLGHRVRLVGGLERPREEVLLAHGLGRVLRVDARRPEVHQPLHAAPAGGLDHVRRDEQVVVEELGGPGGVGHDAAHGGRGEEDGVGPLGGEERLHVRLAAEVQLGQRPAHDAAVAAGLEAPHHGREVSPVPPSSPPSRAIACPPPLCSYCGLSRAGSSPELS